MENNVKEYISQRNRIFEFKYSLGLLNTAELVEIGIYLLENNIQDDNICILAGLNNAFIDEVLKYYKNVLSRFELTFNDNIDQKQLEEYGILCIEEYLKGKMPQKELARIIDSINSITVFSTDFATFDQIEDDRSLLNEIGHPVFNPEMTKSNYESFFNDFIKTFYELKRIVHYNDLETTCYCQKCMKIQKLKLKNKIFSKIQYWACSNCGSTEYTHCKTLNGMKYYIKEKRLTTAST